MGEGTYEQLPSKSLVENILLAAVSLWSEISEWSQVRGAQLEVN